MKSTLVAIGVLGVVLTSGLSAEEEVDDGVIAAIKMEGLQRSQAMDLAFQLTEVHGPRLHGSASLLAAAEWARDQMSDWGLANARLESWDSEVPVWDLESYDFDLISPRYLRFNAFPVVWTPSTEGVLEGVPVVVHIQSEDDFEEHRGKLQGAIVFNGEIHPPAAGGTGAVERLDDERLDELSSAIDKGEEPGFWEEWKDWEVEEAKGNKIVRFFHQEGVAAVVQPSSRPNGIVRVSYSGLAVPEENAPSFVLGRESWQMVARLVEKGLEPRVRLESRIEIGMTARGHNVLAEIPGSDPEIGHQVVLLGGHLDAWPSGSGATDNASGCAVIMEAARILQAIGAKPRRTIRVGLWDGEEYDYGGSLNYVKRHLADPETMQLEPGHADHSAYFNLDNGTGKVRGVYLQGNEMVRPIFEAWLEPFHYLGARTLSSQNTSGTDHQAFDAVGLPAYQFIQDPLAYDTVTHHTDQDVYSQLSEDDLKQAAVIMASFAYHAAMRDEMLPRMPLPVPTERDGPDAD